MSKDSETRRGRLLSKVVKFVTSPTTHWSDLDRPETSSGDAESRVALKEMIVRRDLSTLIEVDGGVNLETGKKLIEAGADVLVAGSYVFNADDPIKAIKALKAL